MTVTIKLFASIRDRVGSPEVGLEIPENSTVEEMVRALAIRYPGIEPWVPYMRVAVGWEYVTPGRIIREGEEIAIIPPVSGG